MSVDTLIAKPRGVEWPTVALIAVVYGFWGLVTWEWRTLPFWLLPLVGGWSVAWHLSLQHELLHGHPTRWTGVNTAFACWGLSLWLPYECYRASHLHHHRDNRLTDPLDDPESNYWTTEQWRALGPLGRFAVRAEASLLGRVLFGPAWSIPRYFSHKIRLALTGNRDPLWMFAKHALTIVPVLAWVLFVCKMPFWVYALCFAYAGTSMARIRSFAEHRADDAVGRRTAIVEDA